MTRLRRVDLVGWALAIFLFFFVVMPILTVLLWAFAEQWFYPSLLPTRWGFKYWREVLERPDVWSSLSTSLQITTIVTALSALICLPAAYAFARLRMPLKQTLFMSILMANAFPRFAIIVAIAVLFLSLNLVGTWTGIVVYQLVATILLMVWLPAAAFRAVSREMEEAARDMGARAWQVFWYITLPQALPTIAAALLMTFVWTFYETEGAWLIGAPRVQTTPLLMVQMIRSSLVNQYGAVLTVMLWVPSLVALVLARRVLGPRRLRGAWADEAEGTLMAGLFLRDVSKKFGAVAAVEPLSLEIPDGELVCLLGPSGSGKTTLLRMIGGFEAPSTGAILIDGTDVAHVPPEKRPTAMVFQSHALWSHMNVFDNVAFGLKLRHRPKAEIRQRVMATLDLVGLADFAKRLPRQLSGGQQQRVAIARCLVIEPKILLMDEPFASLDQHLRERLREEVRQIQRKLGITTVFVTHGQDEAMALADRIVVMSTGRIEQVGRPDEVYSTPATLFVAGFIGTMNMVEVVCAGGQARGGGFAVAAPVADGPACLCVRPEDFVVADRGVPVTVQRVVNAGAYLLAEAAGEAGTKVRVHLPKTHPVREGARLTLAIERFALFRGDAAVYRS